MIKADSETNETGSVDEEISYRNFLTFAFASPQETEINLVVISIHRVGRRVAANHVRFYPLTASSSTEKTLSPSISVELIANADKKVH